MTVVLSHWTGAAGSQTATTISGVNVLKYNKADNNASTTTIAIPTSARTNYSYYKVLSLNVTVAEAAGKQISNRKFYLANDEASGLNIWYNKFPQTADTYVQANGTNQPDDNTSTANAQPPMESPFTTAWTAAPISSGTAVTWDSDAAAADVTGKNGDYLCLVLGVSQGPSGGTAVTLPDHWVVYDIA